jgi:hypothetical protein
VNVVGEVSQAPKISSLSSSSGFVGNKVVIYGRNFTATGNKVKFGDTNSENNPKYNLNSYDGKTLIFTVPSTYYVACFDSVPSCKVVARMIQAGTYEVSVINDNGTSDVLKYEVMGEIVV